MTRRATRMRTACKALVAGALAISVLLPFQGCRASGSSAAASIALGEFEAYAGDHGAKYRTWFGWDGWGQWCAVFTSWCADQAGLAQAGYAPRDAAVSGWIDWYASHPEAGALLDGATTIPAEGDFIIWKREIDPDACYESHIGVVVGYDPQTNTVYTVEGNLGGGYGDVMRSSYDANANVTFYARPAGSASGAAGCAAALAGQVIDVPDGLGTAKSYMGWSLVSDPSSAQFRLRQQAGEGYDSDGFAKIGSRYVIACTTTFGDVGDLVDFTLSDGTVIECIVGDIKDQDDDGCTPWGHDGGQTVLEFVVSTSAWYSASQGGSASRMHENPGTPGCKPEWSAAVDFATNVGSWFEGAGAASSTGLAGCSSASPPASDPETSLEGVEKALAEGLLGTGMGRVQVAAAVAVTAASGGLDGLGAEQAAALARKIAGSYGSWSAPERLAFESMSDAGQAAEHFGRRFAGLPEKGTDWDAVRSSAESLYGRM